MQFQNSNFAILILSLACVGALAGCAANSAFLQPTEVMLSTDKSTSQIFSDLRTSLAKYKYKFSVEDQNIGLLVSEPRQFSFFHDGQRVAAQQTVQVRQEGGALKIRLSYTCDYSGNLHFSPCKANDTDVGQKISRLNRGVIALVTRVLQKPTIH